MGPLEKVRRHLKFFPLSIVAFLLLTASSCDGQSSANETDTQITDRQFGIYTSSQPVHIYQYSMPRDVMQQIYDATMQKTNTWTVWYALDSRPIDSCPSIGYPIPGGTQLTNPARQITNSNSIATLPQGEPNGLFPPSTSAGTWVLCVHNGQVEPTYVEPNVVTYGHPIKIENGTVVDAGGPSSVTVQIRNADGSAAQVGSPAPTASSATKAPGAP